MDVGSKHGYPAGALSNFSPHYFVYDGVTCNSMEGFLQSLKFKGPEMQEHICTLVGKAAKKAGSKKNWQERQTLWWKGRPIARESMEYSNLIQEAYEHMFYDSKSFREALRAAGDAVFTHSIGRSNPKETVLTEREFIQMLNHCRRLLK